MTNLARYHGRSPRYILSTEDDSLIRVAGPKQVPWEEGTSIKNVSLTGLAFVAPSDLCPLLGEVVKIQFTPPGSRQMACYGIVTRLENISDMSVLVGLHFYKLEMAQRIALAQGLAKKLNEAQERHQALDPVETTQETEALAKFPQRFLLWFLAFTWAFIFGSFIHLGYHGLYSLLLKFF